MKDFSEEWKDVPGTKGLYQISDEGNVRRVWGPNKYKPVKTYGQASNGKLRAFVCIEGNQSSFLVENIIKEVFKRKTPTGSKAPKRVNVFSESGKLVASYSSMGKFAKLHCNGNNISGDIMKALRSGDVCRMYGNLIKLDIEGGESIEGYIAKQKKKEAEKRSSKIVVSIKKSIMITDKDFKVIEVYNDTAKSLASREGVAWGSMKAKLHKDNKIMKRVLSGENIVSERSDKRYIYITDYMRNFKKLM